MQPTINNSSANDIKDTLVSLLTRSDTYTEIAVIGSAVLFAWLLSLLCKSLIKRRVRPHLVPDSLAHHTLRVVSGILFPLFSVIFISLSHTISEFFPMERKHIDGATDVAAAWLLISVILLITKRHLIAQVLAWVVLVGAILNVTGTLSPTLKLLDSLAFNMGTFRLSLLAVLKGVLFFTILMWLSGIVSSALEKQIERADQLNMNSRLLVAKISKIALYAVAFLLTLNAMGVNLTALAVFGGALGVGIGFGLQKITSNFISGIILLLERTIKISDLIQIGTETGWVRKLGIRYTLIENLDGREIMIPNENLITGNLINWTYTNNRARVDVPLEVEYGSDAEKVKAIMLEAARGHPKVLSDPAPTCLLTDFSPNGMRFLLMFWISDINDGIRAARSDIMFILLRRFSEENIRFPFAQSEILIKNLGEIKELIQG